MAHPYRSPAERPRYPVERVVPLAVEPDPFPTIVTAHARYIVRRTFPELTRGGLVVIEPEPA